MAKIFAVLTLLIAIGITVLLSAKQAEPFANGSQSASRLQPGAYTVATMDVTFEDSQRGTDANGDYAGSDTRQLPATIWYPNAEKAQPRPLIVHSHGFSSNRKGGAYLAEHLASLGYVVVAADFPLTNGSAPGGPQVKDVINQPGDVSFIIDQLLAFSDDSNHPLAGMIDTQKIGLMGISLGGMTTLLSAYHPDMGDPRVRAAISIAGPTEQFNRQFFQQKQLPFLMLSATEDALVPYEINARPVLEKIPNAQLISIEGGSHMGFVGTMGLLRWATHADSIGCYVVLSKLDNDDDAEQPWINKLGTVEQGINHESSNQLCVKDPLPKAINPLRQQLISQVAVSSFFESQFGADKQTRKAASYYLEKIIGQELSEVSYSVAP